MRAPGAPIFGGLNITVDAHWPRDHVADEVYPYRGHAFWQWLFGKMGRSTLSMERGRPMMRDRDMIVAGRNVYCSPRQFHELQRAIAAQ